MDNNDKSSTSRVSIPNSMKKTIQNIKEIAKNHNDDDIYAMLKECSMDPNETAQRLIHLDTFHQVKSKRDKRKEVMKSRPSEDSRRKAGHQMQGTRGARGNTYTQYISNDARGQKSNFIPKENGMKEIRAKGIKNPTVPVLKEIDAVQPSHVEKVSSISANGPAKMPNGNLSDVHDSKPDRIESIGAIQQEVRIEKISLEATAHIHLNTSLSKTESTSNGHLNQSDLLNVDVYPTFSPMAKKEASKSEIVAQPNGVREFPTDEKSHVPSCTSAVMPSSLQGVSPLAGAKEEVSEQIKFKFLDGQNVIIPDHIQVPDAVKHVLSFGSIDAGFRVGQNYVKIKNIKNVHSVGDAVPDEAIGSLSSCHKDAVATDNQQSHSHLPAENYPVDIKVSSSVTDDDKLKEDNLPAVVLPFPVVQTTTSYTFGVMPPMLVNEPVQPGGFENQAHFSSSLSGDSPAVSTKTSNLPLTQSIGVGQASVNMSQQPIPLFSQPYPPNYISYGPYFSPLYAPHTMHPYYGHTTFPPPPATSNAFLPTPTSIAAMKNSPPHIKPGANFGNQVPAGVPSGYGVYNSSQVGYSPTGAVTSGNFSRSEDLMPIALKDKTIYSGIQSEGKGTGVWIPTVSRDTPSFPVNSFLNYPQGGFTIYHAMQPMPTSPGLPQLQQSQPTTGHVESVRLPSNAHHQLQPQINWNA